MQEYDIEETIHGVLELQLKYALQTNDVADGIYPGTKGDEMTAEECQDMMVGAYQLQHIDLAREWMEVTLARVSKGDASTSAEEILGTFTEMSTKVKLHKNECIKSR